MHENTQDDDESGLDVVDNGSGSSPNNSTAVATQG